MPTRDHRFIVVAILIVLVAYGADRYFRRASNDVNPHDRAVGRIEAFELKPGEVGVVVRVRLGREPVRAATVWADRTADHEDDDDATVPLHRLGYTDADGLVRVPVPKDGRAQTRLFARDAAGRVGGGSLAPDRLLSAPDVVLLDVAPRTGRLVTTDGQAIPQATLTAESFSNEGAGASGEAHFIEIPDPVQPDYTARTDAEGRFSVPGVPVGFGCRLAFHTSGHGEGELWLPAGGTGECRLAPAGSVCLRVSGDGTAADVQRLLCRLNPADQAGRRSGELYVDGHQTRRHDGSAAFHFTNVVPGAYRLQIDGTPRNPVLPRTIVRVTVAPGRTVESVIALQRTGLLEGRVVDAASGAGLRGVRLNLAIAPLSADDGGYGGSLTSDGDGRFAGHVPAGVPVLVNASRFPRGYASPWSAAADWLMNARPLSVAAGTSQTLPDIKLYRKGAVTGTVVADGRPVPNAVVEVRWSAIQQYKPVTVTTDAAGRFHIAGTLPGQPAAVRVRAAGMVNATVALGPDDLAGPLTIPVSAGNAFQVRGQVTDHRGRPVERARVVVLAVIRPRPKVPVAGKPGQAAPVRAQLAEWYQPVDVEAVFTDGAGRFASGALWPGCAYQLTVSADGLAPRQLRAVEGQAGQTHELPSVVLYGTSAVVAGTVVGTDGRPLAGATVLNSGDGPKRLTTVTDAAGRFTLAGLYGGPTVVVTHKPGYRWAYGVVRPGDPEPRLSLRSLAEPPARMQAFTDEHRRAEAELVRRLNVLAEKLRAARPQAAPGGDPWAEARKDLDAYLAKQTRQPGMSAAQTLLRLADVLAKEDRAKALRVLRAAVASAKRSTLPADNAAAAFPALAAGMVTASRVHALVHSAEAALALGERVEADAWLAEAETLAVGLPEMQRGQPLGALAAAWVTRDPAHAEKLLAAIGPNALYTDMAVGAIIARLLKEHPAKAVPWLDRFQRGDDWTAGQHRSQVAVRLADRDLAQALGLAEGIRDAVCRGLTLARLATVAHKTDAKVAHGLIAKAAAAVADPPPAERDPAQRMGAAVYLLWQAEAVAYPDMASLVALALGTRPPVQAHELQVEVWRSQTLRLAVGVGSLDPAAGRALLGSDFDRDPAGGEHGAPEAYERVTVRALVDPAAALRHLDDLTDQYNMAAGVLAILQRRSTVLQRFGFLEGLWWTANGRDFVDDEE